MKNKTLKILLFSFISLTLSQSSNAESLFQLGVSQNAFSIQPKSLYSTVRAKTIGDLVTILLNETYSSSDSVSMQLDKSSSTTDNFSDKINRFLPGSKFDFSTFDGYGGSSEIDNSSNLTRATSIRNTITTQVVQVMPNGNLVVQGKKTVINSKERMEYIISGIVDPRFIDNTGSIQSNLIANLQIAATGKGVVSRGEAEGTFNKIIRLLF